MAATESLPELLATHAADIAAARADMGAALPACYDDLWLLRYCLSFPVAAERAEALRKGVAWREAHAALLADAAAGRPAPHASVIGSSQVAGYHGATRQGDPLFVVRSGLCQPVELMKVCSVEEFSAWLMYWREVGFLMCERETRARGHLVKQITLIDLKDSPITVFDRKYFTALGESGKVSEYVYPQLLRRSVIMHPPAFFSTVFAFMKPFMSAKQLEKTTLCPGSSAARPSLGACPFAREMFEGADVPTFLGGSCRCAAKGGCICERPNEQCSPGPRGGPREAVITVGARSMHDVMLAACVMRRARALGLWAPCWHPSLLFPHTLTHCPLALPTPRPRAPAAARLGMSSGMPLR